MFRFRHCCCRRCFYCCCCCCFVLDCCLTVCSNVTSSMRVRVATSSRFTKSGVHCITPEQRPPSFSNKSSSFLSFHQESCPLNCALPMPGTADGDVVSRCLVLGRAGSVHHGADQYMLHGLPDATVTSLCFV